MIALCLGGGRNVWADYARAREMVGPHMVVACNFSGIAFDGSLDAWVTLHPDRLEGWMKDRAVRGLNMDFRTFAHEAGADEVVAQRWDGSSGLYMAEVALEQMGATGAILCGVPMEAESGHIDAPGLWVVRDRYRKGFGAAKADAANIRSMSGWTAELFGEPDVEWLRECGVAEPRMIARRTEATMRIRMLQDRDYVPADDPRATVAFIAGREYTTRRVWGEEMVAAGQAEEIDAPAREEEVPVEGRGRRARRR